MLCIKVLGPGCARCERLEQYAEEALAEVVAEQPGVSATIEKITGVDQFVHYGVLATPGLVVNEKLVSSGQIPTRDEIKEWLREALEQG
jgi:small redox-active disulfide protein 2